MTQDDVSVCVEVCREGAVPPAYAREGDAGMDVQAAVETVIRPGETAVVWTGLKFAVPPGFEIQVRPRSGLSLRTPLRIPNTPGTIDSGYRGELGILMTNTSGATDASGAAAAAAAAAAAVNRAEPEFPEVFLTADEQENRQGTYRVRPGDRIAQLVLARVPRMQLVPVEDVAEIGRNRGGGFGSTGLTGSDSSETGG